jgi:voltage-gated potassium channel
MNWLLQWRFRTLLLSLSLLIVVYPLMRRAYDTRLLFNFLLSLVFLAGLLVIFKRPHYRLIALLLGIPALVGLWTDYVLPGEPHLPLVIGFHALGAVFISLALAALLRDIYGQELVSADSIYGAFCGYLLVALAFSHLYSIIECIEPDSFQGSEAMMLRLHDVGRRNFLLVYFSLITLTTVGYGDITPVSESAQGLAAVEAVLGQFYIAVLIAELLGKRVAQVIANQRHDRL